MNVNDLWQSYEEKVIPPAASEDQVIQLKMAFYAGGVALASLVRGMDKNDPVKAFENLETELLTFSATLGAEHATIN